MASASNNSSRNNSSRNSRVRMRPRAEDTQVELKMKDALDLESNYYIMSCERLLAGLENKGNKREFIIWFNIFASPILSAQPQEIRIKRNRYLFLMMASLLNDDIAGFLNLVKGAHENAGRKPGKCSRNIQSPMQSEKTVDEHNRPKSTMVAICPTTFQYPVICAPEWELEKRWDSVLCAIQASDLKLAHETAACRQGTISQKLDYSICSFHLDKCQKCPGKDMKLDVNAKPKTTRKRIECGMDSQFEFLVALAAPYVTFLPNSTDNASLWFRALCEIDRAACFEMKGVRNDYMKLFVGYLSNNHLVGPFESAPIRPIPALSESAKVFADRTFDKDISLLPLSPLSNPVQQFMNEVPIIDEGAFAFISLSGSLFGYPAN